MCISASESYSGGRVESKTKRAQTVNATVMNRMQMSAEGLRARQGSKLGSTNFTVSDASDVIDAEGANPLI